MRTSDMIKSKFWRAADLEGRPPVVLTISDVSEEIIGRGPRPDVKVIMWFEEHAKGLRLSKTSINTLEAAYGPESTAWTGRKVKLLFDPTVEFGGRRVGGVKVVTPSGVVYNPAQNPNLASWGQVPSPTAPLGAPPPPVWDAARGLWITPAPIAAPVASPAVPPPPVWDGTQWVTVNPGTGETQGPPPTISQRVNAGHPPAEGEDPEFGHPDIPF